MDVNFNNVRLQAINAYNALAMQLNRNQSENWFGTKVVTVMTEQIQEAMDDLGNAIVIIALTHEDGNSDFKEVLTDDIEVVKFNPDVNELYWREDA